MSPFTSLPSSGWPEGRGRGSSSNASVPAAGAAAGTFPGPTLSTAVRTGGYLSGRQSDVQEVERVLSHVAAARDRAEQARRRLARTRAEPELIDALAESEEQLREAQRRLIRSLDAGAPGPLATA